jgi:hypothetical protein
VDTGMARKILGNTATANIAHHVLFFDYRIKFKAPEIVGKDDQTIVTQ